MEYALTEKKRQPGRKTRQNVSQDTGMPVYALKNPRQKYAWQEIPKKNTEQKTGQQDNFGIVPDVIQMMRKRVYREADAETADVSPKDIFYDNKKGKYFTEMETEKAEQNQKVDESVGKELSPKIAKNMNPETLYLVDIGGKFADYKNVDWGSDSSNNCIYFLKEYTNVYTEGKECEPIAIRLYAEGDMRHAMYLADGFLNRISPEMDKLLKYQKLLGLSESSDEAVAETMKEIIIKATELRKRKDVVNAYPDNNVPAAGLSKNNLTISFGKETGKMDRESGKDKKDRPNRQYDLIQATFLWIPGKPSKDSFTILRNFYINRYEDLKDTGRIRAILGTEKVKGTLAEQNRYSVVAEELVKDDEIKKIYDIKMYKLQDDKQSGKKYSDALTAIGLNVEGNEGFKHTRTKCNIEAKSEGDIIVEGKKRKTEPSVENIAESEKVCEEEISDQKDATTEDISKTAGMKHERVPADNKVNEAELKNKVNEAELKNKVNEAELRMEAERIIDTTPGTANLPSAQKQIIAAVVAALLLFFILYQ